MAYLSRIFVYPIKSLDMASLDTVKVLPSGALVGDRRYAIIDQHGQYVNGKKNARVHLLRSWYDPTCHKLTIWNNEHPLQHTFCVKTERSELESWLSDFFSMPVTFRENTDAGFPDDTDSPGPTLVSTATLREVASWFDFTLDQARARFRANLEIDGVPPFWEDQLFGPRGTTVRFKMGDVVFDGINPCQRCIVPARDQSTGANIPDFAKRFVEMRKNRFPEWAESTRFNHFYRLAINTRLVDLSTTGELNLGDRIEILGQTGIPEVPTSVAASSSRLRRWSGVLNVQSVVKNTPSVSTFRMSAVDGSELPFTYLPGQFINVEMDIEGVVYRRCYTIASAPTQTEYCEISVKRQNTGTVSRYLHDNVGAGSSITVSGPGGRFTFQEDDAQSLFLIGAGVGITPLMSKIRYLTDKHWPGEIKLLYCARSEQEIVFRDELLALQKAHPNLQVTVTLTREPGSNWAGNRGRITREMIRQTLPASKDRRVHICGPIELADEITEMLQELRIRPEQIHSEAFGGKLPAPSAAVDNISPITGTATFADSGKSAPIHCGQTLLDVASNLGIPVDRGCLEGICGRCKMRLLSGDVTMEVDEALTDQDRAGGIVLSCQAKPVGSVAIDA